MSNQYSCGCGYNYRRRMTTQDACVQRSQTPQASGACVSQGMLGEQPVAMAYVPSQSWSQPLPLCQGLGRGTIFEDLYKPFCGRGGGGR